MLTKYLNAAMHKATYEILADDGTFYGGVPGFDGVYANAATLEACREEWSEVLEEIGFGSGCPGICPYRLSMVLN